jgi:hypothetical protein
MPDPFHKRFNIDLPIDEARRRFVNRLDNLVQQTALDVENLPSSHGYPLDWLMRKLKDALGETQDTFISGKSGFIDAWRTFVNIDFSRCLRATEALSMALATHWLGASHLFNRGVRVIVSHAEADIGVSWHDGFFLTKGAKLLDVTLVNDTLRWLADPKFKTVLDPFEKGLSHLLEGMKDPRRWRCYNRRV